MTTVRSESLLGSACGSGWLMEHAVPLARLHNHRVVPGRSCEHGRDRASAGALTLVVDVAKRPGRNLALGRQIVVLDDVHGRLFRAGRGAVDAHVVGEQV